MLDKKDVNAKKTEEWGKTKFKPTVRTTQNPFTKPQNFSSISDRELSGRGGFNGHHSRVGHNGRGGHNSRGGRGGRFNGRGGRFNGRGGSFSGNRGAGGKFNKDKRDRVQFNAIARDAKPDIATPWTKFKDEINYKQREEAHQATQANMNTDEAKMVIKQREINYRRLLMEQKKEEEIQWEDFGENESKKVNVKKGKKDKQQSQSLKDEQVPVGQEDNIANNVKVKKHKKKKLKEEKEKETGFNAESALDASKSPSNEGFVDNAGKKKIKKNKKLHLENESVVSEELTEVPNLKKRKKNHKPLEKGDDREAVEEAEENNKLKKKHKFNKYETPKEEQTATNSKECKPLLSEDELKNFDAKNLTFHQKDVLRKILTKSITIKKGVTLKQSVNNLKFQQACKEKKKKERIIKNNKE